MVAGLVLLWVLLLDGDATHLPEARGMSVMIGLYERVKGSTGGWKITHTDSFLPGLRLYLVHGGRAGMSAVGTTVSSLIGRIRSWIDVRSKKRFRCRGRGVCAVGCRESIVVVGM